MPLTIEGAQKLANRGIEVAEAQDWRWVAERPPSLVLPLCPPVNNLFPSRGRFRVKSQKYLDWEDEAEKWFCAQGLDLVAPMPTGLRWWLDAVFFMPTWGSGDLDNRNKATIDFLCAHRGLQDKYLMRVREVRVTDGSRLAGVVLSYGAWKH